MSPIRTILDVQKSLYKHCFVKETKFLSNILVIYSLSPKITEISEEFLDFNGNNKGGLHGYQLAMFQFIHVSKIDMQFWSIQLKTTVSPGWCGSVD